MNNRILQEYQKTKEEVRLNKYLSEAGVCSRREADRLIESGRVSVDGKRAQTGMKIVPGQVVKVGKKVVSKLMTNNGDIINKMMRAGNRHEKEYKVTVDKEITQEFLEKMASGVPILDTVTRPCKVEKIGKMWYSRQ